VSGITSTRAIVHSGGRERSMLLVRPERATSGAAAALLIVLHGSNQTGDTVRAFSSGGFDDVARSGAAVVAYPDGVGRHWNDARSSIQFSTRRQDVDDVAFLTALIDALVVSDGIDRSRVFFAGFSNGAAMVIRMLLQRPDVVAGAAIIAATLPAPENLLPIVAPALPVPVVQFHGTRDPLVPYDGGMASLWGLKPRGMGLSALATAVFFARRNGIAVAPTRELLPSIAGAAPTIELTEFSETGRPEVRLYTILGGGHVIPGPHRPPPAMGHATRDLVATDVIAEFFGL
jgi:polyhydroxybutyrate depolymerase